MMGTTTNMYGFLSGSLSSFFGSTGIMMMDISLIIILLLRFTTLGASGGVWMNVVWMGAGVTVLSHVFFLVFGIMIYFSLSPSDRENGSEFTSKWWGSSSRVANISMMGVTVLYLVSALFLCGFVF